MILDIHKSLMHASMLSHFSRIQLCVTLWTLAHQAPLSMGSSRKEYWNGLPCPPPGDLLDPGIKPASLTSPALANEFLTISITWEAPTSHTVSYFLSFSEASWQSPWCNDTVSVSDPCLGIRQRVL